MEKDPFISGLGLSHLGLPLEPLNTQQWAGSLSAAGAGLQAQEPSKSG